MVLTRAARLAAAGGPKPNLKRGNSQEIKTSKRSLRNYNNSRSGGGDLGTIESVQISPTNSNKQVTLFDNKQKSSTRQMNARSRVRQSAGVLDTAVEGKDHESFCKSSVVPSWLSGCGLKQFLLTYFCYAAIYLTRKPVATAKGTLQQELGISTRSLGVVDSGFLGFYAIGQLLVAPYVSAKAAGKTPAVTAVVYFISAFSCGMCTYTPSNYQTAAKPFISAQALLTVAWCINGLAQSLAFPFIVSALSSWLLPNERGQAIGLWTTCQQVGSILANFVAAAILQSEISLVFFSDKWRAVFAVPALGVGICGLFLLFFLRENPLGIYKSQSLEVRASLKASKDRTQGMERDEPNNNISIWLLLLIPAVRWLGVAYFCIKLSRYAFLYWLGFFLTQHAGISEVKAGGALGSVLLGIISDRFFKGRRLILLVPLCIGAAVTSFLLFFSVDVGVTTIPYKSVALIILLGAFISGPDSVLGGAAAADALADDDSEKGRSSQQLLTAASCMVNGCGSVGAIVQAAVTPFAIELYGWRHLRRAVGLSQICPLPADISLARWFGFFAVVSCSALLGSLALLPGALRDVKIVS